MPASRTAKSPACDDGKRSATKSSNVPVKPGSPGHVGHVAMARVTDVWNSRTWERSAVSRSTLIASPRSCRSAGRSSSVPLMVTLMSAHWPSFRLATLSLPSFVNENSTLSYFVCKSCLLS